MRRERILSHFLDNKLYSQNLFDTVRRTNSIEEQYSGSDIVVSVPSRGLHNAIVDEKAQLYYLNGGLPTFAFELNFVNKAGKRIEGWLTDQRKKTEYYQLLFLTAQKDFESVNQIREVEYILVERSEILKQIDLDMPALRQKGLDVAQSSDFYQHKSPSCDYYFTHSTRLAESPVNIIIRKQKLIQISILHGTVV